VAWHVEAARPPRLPRSIRAGAPPAFAHRAQAPGDEPVQEALNGMCLAEWEHCS